MMEEQFFVSQVQGMTDAMYRVSISILHHRQDAQDAVQQAIFKAWQARERVREDYFRSYLMRIVINECHNVRRKSARLTPSEQMEMYAGVEQAPDMTLRDALMRLPENLRIVLILKYLEGYSEKDMARTLRLPVSTVKSRLRHGRDKLRDELREDAVCEMM